MSELLVAAVLLHGVGVTAPPGEVTDDSLDKLTRALDGTNKSAADKLDALSFAMRGRLATRSERWQAKCRYGDNPTAEQFREFVTASAPSGLPPIGWYLRPAGLPEYATPVYGRGPFGQTLEGWYVPAQPPVLANPGFVPNPLALPFRPWIPPASVAPPRALPEKTDSPTAPAPRAVDDWTKPVLVASTVARVYDISPDGMRFLFADGRKFGCFDRASGKMVWQIDNTTVSDAKFSPDGKMVAAGEWQNGLIFYDAASGKKLHTIPAGEERPGQVHYQPDGTLLYHTSWSSLSAAPPWTRKDSIIHYEPAAKKELKKVSDSLTYSGTNPWLWHRGAGFFMETHRIYGTNTTDRRTASYTDPITGKATPTIDLHVNDIPLDLSPDGKLLLVMTAGEPPRLVDTATGKTKVTLGDHKRHVTEGAFSPDGKLIATVTGTRSWHATRGAQFPARVPEGPAELVVWDAATGKAVSRAEFPTKELDFILVRFSPDSKFVVATSREGAGGKSQGHYAFGAVPFDHTGGAALTFPRDEELKPKPPPVGWPPGVVGDPLDRLIDELAKSNKTAAEKVDALFLAALGRFATAGEQKRVKDKYGDKPAADTLRKLLAEIAATPEFDAHLKSLQKRLPAKPAAPAWPGSPFPGPPFPTFPQPGAPFPGLHSAPGPLGSFRQPSLTGGFPDGWPLPQSFPNGWSGPWPFPSFPPPSPAPKKPRAAGVV